MEAAAAAQTVAPSKAITRRRRTPRRRPAAVQRSKRPNRPAAREVYSALCSRLGPSDRIPGHSVQGLFNDLHLYPSKEQIKEMLKCARKYGGRGGEQYLTFGEFCVLAEEYKNIVRQPRCCHHLRSNSSFIRTPSTIGSQQQQQQQQQQNEVFLGGSCNPTTWRSDLAIPHLKNLGITFYNPQVSTWGPELMAVEHDAKQAAKVLFFVLDNQTRSVAGAIEVAYLAASHRCLVLVNHAYSHDQYILGEKISEKEYVDLTEAKATLLALVEKQGLEVYSNLQSALSATTALLRGKVNELPEKLRKLREAFDTSDSRQRGELNLLDACRAFNKLSNRALTISDLKNIFHSCDQQTNNSLSITFEKFCGLVAEFNSPNGYNITKSNNASQSGTDLTLYWKIVILKARLAFYDYVVRPILNSILAWPLQRRFSATTNNNTLNHSPANAAAPPHEGVKQSVQSIFAVSANQLGKRSRKKYSVFLGGSVKTAVAWRDAIAAPLLRRHGLTWCSPAALEKAQEKGEEGSGDAHAANLAKDLASVEDCAVLVFVVTADTRSVSTMVLAAHYIGLRRDVVLCVQNIPQREAEGAVQADKISEQAIKDYNRGRAYLTDLATRENVPVFDTVSEALQCAVDKCLEGKAPS